MRPMQVVWVPSLREELRSHMLCGVAKQKKIDSGEDENIFLNNVLFFLIVVLFFNRLNGIDTCIVITCSGILCLYLVCFLGSADH